MYAISPAAVVLPRTTLDVIKVVELAGAADVPVVARGGGTSLAGQTVGPGIVVDFSRHMRRIVKLDAESCIARVQPGVVQDQLNRAAAKHGLMFGADTSTSNRATLGGMIGNNSSGTHSIRYGTTADHVRALEVVLSDGSQAVFGATGEDERPRMSQGTTLEGAIHRRLPGIISEHAAAIRRDHPAGWRQSGGYRLDRLLRDMPRLDLAKFVVGTEGTLAIVTEADLALVPVPRSQAIAVGHFRSRAAAIAATGDALSLEASAVELMDRTILDLSRTKREYAGLSKILEGDPDALLFVTFFGDAESDVTAQLDRLTTLWAHHGHGYHTLRATSAADRAEVLKVRKASLGLLMAASRGARRPLAFVEDTAVDPARLEEYVTRFDEILKRFHLSAGFYGHCSVGCLHIRPFVDLRRPAEVKTMREVAEAVVDLVIEFGGVNSSEHGDGLARSEFNNRVFGPDLYEAMREVKRLFDPSGLLNPGKMVDAPPMTEHLREARLPPARPLVTRLHFSDEGGFRGAAERCMNIGACRKTDVGTMCPSYMATFSEEHATRGRANALVAALSQADPHRALGDERLHEILDLCLECKACKSECPLGVDMASMKSEALAHYQDIHGIPLRARIFGHIRAINRLGAATAPLSNLPGRSAVVRSGLDRMVGITSRRPLPSFERETLMRWYRRQPTPAGGHLGEVVFVADSFTSYTETRVARAAIKLLQIAGWRVVVEARGCCGRASFSKGLLDQARTMAREMVDRLLPYAARGVPIVGCEPSCLLTICDEYLQMLPNDPRAKVVADRVTAIADLLLAGIDNGDLKLRADSPISGRRIVVHPHCHEKAVTGTRATVDLLRRIPGAIVGELDAGCCGMAGSFGFETEHYDLSTDIARLRLLPALEGEADDVILAATGVSCRQQIRHLAGRESRHPLELILEAVVAQSERASSGHLSGSP